MPSRWPVAGGWAEGELRKVDEDGNVTQEGSLTYPSREQLYYIVCTRYPAGWNMSFWRPNAAGYTIVLDQAGKYTAEEVKRCNGTGTAQNFAVPCEVIDALAHRGVDRDNNQFELMNQYLPPKPNGERYGYGDVR